MSSSLAWFFLLIDSLLLPVNPTGKAVPPHQLYQYVPNSAQLVFHLDFRFTGDGRAALGLYRGQGFRPGAEFCRPA